MARYTLGISCSHATHSTLVIGDNATFRRRDQSGDLPFFRVALTAGIEQHVGWAHRYSQSQGCIYTTDATSRPSPRGEHHLERTCPEEDELAWPRAEPGNELSASLQAGKVPWSSSVLNPSLTGGKPQGWTLACNDLFRSQHRPHAIFPGNNQALLMVKDGPRTVPDRQFGYQQLIFRA